MILSNFDVFVCLGPVWGALGLTSNLFGPFGMIQTCLVASGTNRDAFRMHLGAHEANPLILGCSELAHACKGPRGLENPCLSEYWSFVGDKLLHPCLLRCFSYFLIIFPYTQTLLKQSITVVGRATPVRLFALLLRFPRAQREGSQPPMPPRSDFSDLQAILAQIPFWLKFNSSWHVWRLWWLWQLHNFKPFKNIQLIKQFYWQPRIHG